MRAISENTVIQIEITNACHLSCANCTRHVGHHRKPFFMDVEFFEKAVRSVLLAPTRIGIMGGEPTLHPKFDQILNIYEEMVPIYRREFWTAGFKWDQHNPRIKEVFWYDRIAYNDHTAFDGKHKPLLIAIDDVVEDPELKAHLIENCPYQSHWSASITPKGGFFCEIAASMDWLFDGPGGYDISDMRWWDRTPAQFQDQVDEYCGKCGGAIPMESESDARGGRCESVDTMSHSNYDRLLAVGSPKVQKGNFRIWDKKIDYAWAEAHNAINPRAYRTFVAHDKKDIPAPEAI